MSRVSAECLLRQLREGMDQLRARMEADEANRHQWVKQWSSLREMLRNPKAKEVDFITVARSEATALEVFDRIPVKEMATTHPVHVVSTPLVVSEGHAFEVLDEKHHKNTVFDEQRKPFTNLDTNDRLTHANGFVYVSELGMSSADEVFVKMQNKVVWVEDKPSVLDTHEDLLQQLATGEEYIVDKDSKTMDNVMCAVAGGIPTSCSTVCLTRSHEEIMEVSADQALDGLPCVNDSSDGNDREDGEAVPWLQDLQVACAASMPAGCEKNSLVDVHVTRNMSTDVDCSSPYLEFGVIDAGQMFKEMPLEATWDGEMQSDIHLHEGLLKQLAQGGNCLVGVERKLKDEPGTNYLHTQVVLLEHVEFVDSKGATHEMFNEISFENVIWDEEMPDQDTDNLLQLIVSDREHLDSEKAKSIIEFDDVGGIIWDEDMPHNFGMHLNLLEQFADVKQGQRDNDFPTEFGNLPLFLQHDVIIANDIFDVLAVQELNLGIENLVNCKKLKGESVCSFEKCVIDSLLGNLSSLGGFSQRSNVNRHMLEKMTAWWYGSFSPGQSELSVVDGEKLHNEIALKANGNLHLKDHGAGFGVVFSLLLRHCRSFTGYVVKKMPAWSHSGFSPGECELQMANSIKQWDPGGAKSFAAALSSRSLMGLKTHVHHQLRTPWLNPMDARKENQAFQMCRLTPPI